MSIVRYDITIGSKTFASSDEPIVKKLVTQNDLGIPLSSAEITVISHKDLNANLGDAVVIKIGDTGKIKPVFTGIIQSVVADLHTVTIKATSKMEILARTHVNAAFENKSCGEIFKDITSQLDIKVGEVEDGVTFPNYTISDELSLWRHLKQLAIFSGFDIYTDSNDMLSFKKIQVNEGITYTYGLNILLIEKEAIKPSIDGVEVYGVRQLEGTQGDEAGFDLVKDEMVGTAGKKTGNISRYAIPTAKNSEHCQELAQNILGTLQKRSRGRAILLNGEKVELGGAVSIEGTPLESMNETFKIVAVKHEVNKETGFTTEVLLEQQSS